MLQNYSLHKYQEMSRSPTPAQWDNKSTLMNGLRETNMPQSFQILQD